MNKKLNIAAITNELSGGSAFFPSRSAQAQPATPPAGQEQAAPEPVGEPAQPNPPLPERANARTPDRPAAPRRIIVRHSFELYDDQVDSLRTLSLEEKMAGKLGSMSQMVRDAIDHYLKDRTPKK
jgi:hypothetical protein